MIKKLTTSEAYKKCNPNIFKAKNSNDIAEYKGTLGQNQVVAALELAVGIKHANYNIFALGPNGIGKKRLVKDFLQNARKNASTALEYCYVHNFETPEKPIYLEFKPTEAKTFKTEMQTLVEEAKVLIPSALTGEAFTNKLNQLEQKYSKRQEEKVNEIRKEADDNNLSLVKAPNGFAIVAVDPKTKKPLEKDQIEKLTATEKEKIKILVKEIQEKLEDIINDIPNLEKEKQKTINELKHKTIKKIIEPKINKIIKQWQHNPKVDAYLKRIKDEIISHPDYFYEENTKETSNPFLALLSGNKSKNELHVFEVNIMVAKAYEEELNSYAPLVVLDNPSYSQLFGKIEYIPHFGTLSTNLTLIKPGALHQANGGFLVVNARGLLELPVLWYQLKKVIKTGELSFGLDMSMGNNVVTLEPEPIPFTGKIILLGEPDIYNALWHFDPEFKELFKVTAEFNNKITYNEENALIYAGIAASITKKEGLKALDKLALAKLVEIGAREVASQKHITSNLALINDVIREANFMAITNNSDTVTVTDIEKAFNFRKERLSRIPNYIKEQIKEKVIVIATDGLELGQINGLSVIRINEFYFGQPQRISCTVYKGEKDILDIERTVSLSGAIHSKGVLILSAFLHGRFSKKYPLAFSATINFEQSYGMIDGDSASAAEAIVLMASLAGIPVKQNLAITGSIDQKGRVQAIGGVNEKIEGFFEICKSRGLTEKHGVIIPASNASDLMLKAEVLEAIANNKFSIYAINHVDEGLELLTGKKPGELDKNNNYPKNSINGIIANNWLKKSKTKKAKSNHK